MFYSFRVFAAIYGYRTIESNTNMAEYSCFYGGEKERFVDKNQLHIPARYTVRRKQKGLAQLQKIRYASQEIHLVHGRNNADESPDWLGEIFEWLSGNLEVPVIKRDEAGRIPYSETVFGKQGITPSQPHAALLMAWMENALQNGGGSEALPKASSPVSGVEHMVVCSHDIDFYYEGMASAFVRLAKNLGIAALLYRSPSFFASNLRMMMELLGGKHVGEYIPGLLDASEECGFRSTLFAVAGGNHRRDPNYRAEQIAAQLSAATKREFSIGLHGSYGSVVDGGSLKDEARRIGECVGEKMLGSRQHWLRFDDHAKLYASLENAGMIYDSSLGFSETCGFRNGANFAFPPYDFAKEKPCEFLEIPLVIMDGSLEQASRRGKKPPQELASEILEQSRKWGWGGISLLWHNPMEAIQVSREVNEVFWNCARKRKAYGEQWMSADQFMEQSLGRYQEAGLLQKVKLDA